MTKKLLTKILGLSAVATAMVGTTFAVDAQTRGVTDTEIVIGSNADLSGVFAPFSVPAMEAAKIYFDEINEKGGVHGRKIKLVVEDHGYSLPKATQALNKLINRDKVFAMFMSLGTPMNIAGFKFQDPKDIVNFGPLSAARQLSLPLHKLHYAGTATYYDQIRQAVKYVSQKNGRKKICAMYFPSDFGKEIYEGAVDMSKELGLEFIAETTHKPDDGDFVGALTKLKDAGCEVVVMALGVRQVITAYATARKIGWDDADFVVSSAGFHTSVAQVPGGITNGLYAGSGWADLVARKDVPEVAAWIKKYTEVSGEKFPGTGALLGRSTAESFVRALEAAGPDLTTESLIKGIEGLSYEDVIASNKVDYSATDHVGADEVIISEIKDGNWVEIGRVK